MSEEFNICDEKFTPFEIELLQSVLSKYILEHKDDFIAYSLIEIEKTVCIFLFLFRKSEHLH